MSFRADLSGCVTGRRIVIVGVVMVVAGWGQEVGAEPVSLEEAMEAAVVLEVDAVGAVDVEVARARARIARGALLPTLVASGTLTLNNDEVVVGDRVFVNRWDYGANLRAQVDLFRGSAWPAWRAAQEEAEAVDAARRWTRAELRLLAGQAYLAALAAERNVEVARQTIALRQAAIDDAQARLDTGLGVGSELTRAQLGRQEAEAAALDAELALADALDQLAILIGVEALEAGDLAAPALGFEAVSEAVIMAERADFERREALWEAADWQVTGRWLDFLPTLSLIGQYNFGRPSLRAPEGVFWTLSLSATWVIYDDSRYGRLDEARALRRRVEVEQSQAARVLSVNRRTALRRVARASDRVTLGEQTVAVAQENRDLVATGYRLGEASSLEMAEADERLFRARIQLNLLRLERDIARLELAQINGQLDD